MLVCVLLWEKFLPLVFFVMDIIGNKLKIGKSDKQSFWYITQNLFKAKRKLPNYQCVAFIKFICF